MNAMRKVRYTARGVDRLGYFHEWVTLSDHVYAIVENDDGTVVVVRMQSVRFIKEEQDGKDGAEGEGHTEEAGVHESE